MVNLSLSRQLRRQRGTIAVLFAFTLVVLLVAGGLVLDLGHLYILKSELQNASDSAALAGAKELNLSADGINKAAAAAISFAGKNKFNFSSAVTITASDVTFSAAPDGPFYSVAESVANFGNKTFIRVQTGSRAVPTYLMRVQGINSMETQGVAVAGRFVVDITPIGVCAVDPLNRTAKSANDELIEFGFRRGLTYDIQKMADIGGNADAMLINPVDSPPNCTPSHNSANFTAPFICQGNSAVTSNATQVYANPGLSSGSVEKALNSRFEVFQGSSCQPASAPPDTNIQEYAWNDNSRGAGAWMSPQPTQQAQDVNAEGYPLPAAAPKGALWSYSRAVHASGSGPDFDAGAPFSTSDWPALYGRPAPTASYPSGAGGSPYGQTSGVFFTPPSVHTPSAKRRQLNLALIDCSVPLLPSMNCKAMPLLGVGKFFMQRKAALTGSDKHFDVEFGGLIEPVPNAEIKLYR